MKKLMRILQSALCFAVCISLFWAALSWQGVLTPLAPKQATTDVAWVDNILPGQLSKQDIELYQTAWSAQRKSDWDKADEALNKLSNQMLLGDVLAERYLHRHYSATVDELTAWLANYRETPQAYNIYQMLQDKSAAASIKPVEKPVMLSVMGDDNGLAANFDESKHYGHWQVGMAAYKRGEKAKAAEQFEKMMRDNKQLSPWQLSAAGYWAWRAYTALGEHENASRALHIAASEPRSFYGILARKQLKQSLDLNQTGLTLTGNEFQHLLSEERIARTLALVQTGRSDLAERELRIAFSGADKIRKHQLLKLAHALSLPAIQISMAKRLETEDVMLDAAKYPVPDWTPVGGFNVDPALIFALVRQESGFRTSAVSPAGAMGLMQVMPNTATMMKNKMGNPNMGMATEVERNVTIGQYYVRHLLENPLVNNNIIYMLTAYNAGAGRLQDWKQTIRNDDPLLFIENIPYEETRHYVMQVMTNYWLYSELLGTNSASLAELATGNWPRYAEVK